MDDRGLQLYGAGAFGAKYLVLYGYCSTGKLTKNIWSIAKKAPTLINHDDLMAKGYPKNSSKCNFYLLYQIKKEVSFKDNQWDVSKLNDFKGNYRPFSCTLLELLNTAV